MKEIVLHGSNPPSVIYVRIEIPIGSKVKYEYNKQFNTEFVDRILHSSVVYPITYERILDSLYGSNSEAEKKWFTNYRKQDHIRPDEDTFEVR